MMSAAGYPEVARGAWSDALFDDLIVYGGEAQVAEGLEGLFDLGASEVVVTPVTAGPDRPASEARTLRLLADMAK